ncbi:iron ABC transporter permease [Brachybacterium endophyticum]|uniref:Iron ABC transporter permease n=1 Tax=Brachybacterium endophyticum TaxID=2182385 RepID=A0A2U2RNE6_9MICO|nr:iron ABC transporter permease [Brachybacterium endophyticum]PWH07304.1 iron ABC transporter permease [Brachybacterium endophyticum]
MRTAAPADPGTRAENARVPGRALLGGTRRLPPPLALALGVVLVLVVCLLSLALGSRANDLPQVLAALGGRGEERMALIIDERALRTVVGLAVGAALAVSGQLIQGLTRNPLGEPGLLGVTSGASFAIVVVTALAGSVSGGTAAIAAIPGALAAVALVHLVARPAGTGSVVPLVLAGAVVTAVLGAVVQGLILQMPAVFDSYRYWVVGSLTGADLGTLTTVAPVLLAGLVLAITVAPALNTLALGDDVAISLGSPVRLVRGAGLAAAALLAAAATAAAGPIAFVGLAVPHLVRGIVGADHRWQLPMNLLLGAALLVASDVVARVIVRPEELMVGVVTAFVGAPFLLLAVRRGAVTDR